jgi:predicted RNA-binding Zn-ribbon protein involved in translation (DUF1610 family)
MKATEVPYECHTVLDDGAATRCSACERVLTWDRSTDIPDTCPRCGTELMYVATLFWHDGETLAEATERATERYPIHLSFIGWVYGRPGFYELVGDHDECELADCEELDHLIDLVNA